ncbi:MAG: ATP-binding protein [Thermodesulfobacteriota bacterium]
MNCAYKILSLSKVCLVFLLPLLAVSLLWCCPVYSQLQQDASVAASTETEIQKPGMKTFQAVISGGLALLALLVFLHLWHRRQLARAKARSQSLEDELSLAWLTLDTVPINIFWYNRDFKLTMVNEAACRATGLSRPELLTKDISFFDQNFPTDGQGRTKAWERIKAQGHFSHYGHLCSGDGDCHPTEEHVSFLASHGGDHVVIISEDISEQIKQEKKLKKNAAELSRAKDMAETANRLKNEFLSNMSHEIRTPMNAILGYSEMLTSANLTDREKEYVQTIIKSGKDLIVIINDILDLSKIEAGRLKIQNQSVDTATFFHNIGRMFTERAKAKNIDLQVAISPEIPPSVIFDETRLRQVLFNLLGNAISFTEQGGVTLRVQHKASGHNTIELIIAVEDTGIGIAKNDQETLFEPFHKISALAIRNTGSTGLGLPLSQRLVTLMGGTMALNSNPGKGSVFELSIPGIEVSTNTPASSTASSSGRVSFQEGRVMVVDDNEINCQLIKDFFRKTAVTIISAENGKVALDILKEGKPDLILMDLKMPVMDGYEATDIIKKNPGLADIPIIAISASVLDFNNEESLFDGYLNKPFQIRELEHEMARFLSSYADMAKSTDQAAPDTTGPSPFVSKNLVEKIQEILAGYDKKSGNLSDASRLGQEIEKLGETEGQDELTQLGNDLRVNADRFNILKVEELQDELQKYIKV